MSKYDRVYNFSAGQSMLPLNVIEEAAKDLPNYQGCGQSVMEMSHRSAEFKNTCRSRSGFKRYNEYS